MKRKQKLLKRLEKQNIQGNKILNAIDRFIPFEGLQEIVSSFINKRNHEQSLQEVDSQLLQIIFTKMMENQSQESQVVIEKIKTDVLTQSESQLLAFCREKDLIRLHQYCQTIKNKSHRQHSYYGYLLFNSFPDQFFIGQKCTHYHCKTTAHKIQQQYGIFNNINIAEQSNEQYDPQSQSQQNFIVNSDQSEQEEESVRPNKKNKNDSRKQQQQIKIQSPDKQGKKKNKMKNLLNSQSQQENTNNKTSNKKGGKMQILNEQQQVTDAQAELINEALLQLSISQIISILKYKDIFEYLGEKHIEKLSPLIDVISQTVLINNKKAKRQRSNKKNKSHSKRLSKSKINLKELTLEDLISECIKKNIIQQQDQDKNYGIDEHPNLAHQLLQAQPNNYIIDGDFNAYSQKQINQQFQKTYKEYQEKQQNQEQGQQLDGQEEELEQQYSDDQQGQDDQSNYSVESGQDNLGIL